MYNGMLFNNKKECTETHKAQMSIKAITVSEKNWKQKEQTLDDLQRDKTFG